MYYVVKSAIFNELEAQITEEMVLFQAIYRNSGHDALVATVTRLELHHPAEPRLVGVFGEDAGKLAGNLNIAPDFLGWSKLSLRLVMSADPVGYYAYATRIDKTTIVVGRNLRLTEAVLQALIWMLLLAGVAVSVISLLIGYLSSRGVFIKLQNLAATLDLVSKGDTQVRLPISDSDDQIDRISRQINAHLERLSTLISSTRNTAKAIAHDLRTPLNRAFLLLQEAKNHEAGSRQALTQLIERAEGELSNVGEIFDTILRIARIETSTNRTSFTTFPVGQLLPEMAETYQPVIEEAGQKLTCRPADSADSLVHGDKRMLRQLLANLLENASFHCPEGTEIVLSGKSSPEGRVCIEVSDNGPGIPAEYRQDVLEPFYRLDASRNLPGSGLGLALVKAIAIGHGADIRILDNHPGVRVSIRFPAIGSPF